jgi:TP901 family phage tail tape measure protein
LAQAQTFEGQMRKLKVTFEDIFENIGMALIPALQKLVAYITPIITKITEWTSAHPELTAKIILVVGAISGLIFII